MTAALNHLTLVQGADLKSWTRTADAEPPEDRWVLVRRIGVSPTGNPFLPLTARRSRHVTGKRWFAADHAHAPIDFGQKIKGGISCQNDDTEWCLIPN